MADRPNFEKALARLQEIVDRLERDDLGLDEALGLFDEGMALVRTAEHALSESSGKLKQVIVDRQGKSRSIDLDLAE